MLLVGSNLRHDEVALTQSRTLRVDADKDVCDNIDVQILRKLNHTNHSVGYSLYLGDNLLQLFWLYLWIILAVLGNKLERGV